jgi:ElaA protein
MSAAEIAIRWAADPDELPGALKLREQVFCEEQGVSRSEELDGLDGGALHLLAREPEHEEVIGTLRMLLSAEGAKIGRVAVRGDWRRLGIATRMLDFALDLASERGCQKARLCAQLQSIGLYERAGFAVSSQPFLEAGIPHVRMSLDLRRKPGV